MCLYLLLELVMPWIPRNTDVDTDRGVNAFVCVHRYACSIYTSGFVH